MTKPSTIAVLNAMQSGLPCPPPETPVKVKPAPKPAIIMTEAQLREKEDLRAKLLVGTWIIEFKKIDGTPSIMEATLDPRLLPPADPTATPSTRPEQSHLLHVYAIDRQGWRSFVIPNLTRFYRAGQDL